MEILAAWLTSAAGLLSLWLLPGIEAQGSVALSGRVSDQTGGVIPGATVTAQKQDTGVDLVLTVGNVSRM